MAYVLLSQSYGAAKANLPVTITETSTGIPAVILSSATGGLVSSNGDTFLDASGNLSCYVDGAKTWTVGVDSGATVGPAGLLTGSQIAAGATAVVGVKSDGTLVNGAGATVGLTPTQVTQTQSLVSGGAFPATAYATKSMLNNAGSGISFTVATAGTGVTVQVQTVVESPCYAIQIGVVNADTATAAIKASATAWAAVGASNSSAANFNSNAWTDMTQTVGGVSSGTATLAAMPSSVAGQGVVTWLDVLPLASIPRTDPSTSLHGIAVRIEYQSGANMTTLPPPFTTTDSWAEDTAANGGRVWRVRAQGVLAGTNATKAGFTATANWSSWPCLLIRYWPVSGKPKTIAVFGDSIQSASGGTTAATGVTLSRYGLMERLRTQYSTPANPIEIVDCGLGGADTPKILAMIRTIAPAVPNAIALHAIGTINGTSTTLSATDSGLWNVFTARARAEFEAARVPSYALTMLPVDPAIATTKAWGATDSFRQGINSAAIASGLRVIQIDAPVSGTISGGQVPLTNTVDGIHQTDAGHALQVPVVAAALGIA